MGDLPLLCVKKWFEALTGEFLPFVVSYISHFVCLYNPNYYFRPLSGPSIILINDKLGKNGIELVCTSNKENIHTHAQKQVMGNAVALNKSSGYEHKKINTQRENSVTYLHKELASVQTKYNSLMLVLSLRNVFYPYIGQPVPKLC